MKKKNLKPIIVSALLATAFGATSIGTSFALFTDSAETSIAVTAGKVDVSGGLTGLAVYSAEANASGTVLDENNAKYNLVAQTETDSQGHTLFANKGYAGFATTTTTNDTLNLVNVTPGDKVAFKFDMSNASNVTIKYRVVYEVVNTGAGYLDLVKGLTTTIGEESFTGLKTFKSAWTVAANGVLDDVDFSIYLPMDKGNVYQNKAASIKLSVEAVQGNAVTTEGRVVETIEEDMTTSAVSTGAAIVLQATNVEQSVAVKTTIPAETTETPDGKKVELVVSDLTQASDEESTEKSLEFDLTLKVDGVKVDSFSKLIDVEINVGPGYDITSIKHNGTDIEQYDTTTNPYGYTYDISEGIIRFKTDHFSPFIVNYKTKSSEVMDYATLKQQLAIPYNNVKMLNDIAFPTSSEKLEIASHVVFDGNGKKLTVGNYNNEIDVTGDYTIVKNLDVDTAAKNCFVVSGAYNVLSNCTGSVFSSRQLIAFQDANTYTIEYCDFEFDDGSRMLYYYGSKPSSNMNAGTFKLYRSTFRFPGGYYTASYANYFSENSNTEFIMDGCTVYNGWRQIGAAPETVTYKNSTFYGTQEIGVMVKIYHDTTMENCTFIGHYDNTPGQIDYNYIYFNDYGEARFTFKDCYLKQSVEDTNPVAVTNDFILHDHS